jgi:uncharacterized membrane protein YdbT with pleckstrin-like domain
MIFKILSQSKNSFEGIRPDEVVQHVLRRHWLVPVITIIVCMIAAIVPLIVGAIIVALLGTGGYGPIIMLLYVLYLLFLWLALFYALTFYALDVWIVTNQRIIDTHQQNFFSRTVSDLSITRIQDITVTVDGLLETFLDFGNLTIQTAGTESHFHFRQIPQPAIVKDEIMKLVLEHQHKAQ